jgi:hypothetical protein
MQTGEPSFHECGGTYPYGGISGSSDHTKGRENDWSKIPAIGQPREVLPASPVLSAWSLHRDAYSTSGSCCDPASRPSDTGQPRECPSGQSRRVAADNASLSPIHARSLTAFRSSATNRVADRGGSEFQAWSVTGKSNHHQSCRWPFAAALLWPVLPLRHPKVGRHALGPSYRVRHASEASHSLGQHHSSEAVRLRYIGVRFPLPASRRVRPEGLPPLLEVV